MKYNGYKLIKRRVSSI
ncbi:putative membrane protein, partial [Yersinia pestis PY-66]